MISDLAVTKQTQSGEPKDSRYRDTDDDNFNTNDVQNKTSYFGFRVSSEFKSDNKSVPDHGSGKKTNKL